MLRAAAYTRTGILRRFLEQLAHSDPGRVDAAYAEQRLDLKGGDVRAFLQSLRVLGLIEAYGETTPRARRMRSAAQRAAEMRQALAEAYPELYERWQGCGGMPREEVEDFFKLEYGLSTSSAGPAAKLFVDLMREYGEPELPRPPSGRRPGTEYRAAPTASQELSLPARPELASRAATPVPAPAQPADVRVAALDAIKTSLRIDITADWDEEKIQLVFDRLERLVDRILLSGRERDT